MSGAPPPNPNPAPSPNPGNGNSNGNGQPVAARDLPPIPATGGMRFAPRPQATLRPRKVRLGVRLTTRSGPVASAWSGQRLLRLVEDNAPGAALAEGIEYARLGQTRNFITVAGHVSGRVQGRMPQAYVVDVRMPVYAHDEWEKVIGAMLQEARPVATLLSGEVPSNIEDLFAPLRLRLFPQEASDLACTCTCADFTGGQRWCKHICCIFALLAERLSVDPFLMFRLRGLDKEELLERLRQRRAIDTARTAPGASDRPMPAYLPGLPGISDAPTTLLELTVDHFWSTGAALAELDLPLGRPAVGHALLRRLGPTPFDGATFPLVGLLATCYDVISEASLKVEQAGDAVDAEATPEGDQTLDELGLG
ncbi:MAG: hypothetical protein ACREJO_06205 [Phycisphaerales bacterium]